MKQSPKPESKFGKVIAYGFNLLFSSVFFSGGINGLFSYESSTLRCNRIDTGSVSCELIRQSVAEKKVIKISPSLAADVETKIETAYHVKTYQAIILFSGQRIPFNRGRFPDKSIVNKVHQINTFVSNPESTYLSIQQDTPRSLYIWAFIYTFFGGSMMISIFRMFINDVHSTTNLTAPH